MKTALLLLTLIAFGNAQDTKTGTYNNPTEQCPTDICKCETVQDTEYPSVFYMMATCTAFPPRLDSIRFLKIRGEFNVITQRMISGLGTHIRKLDFSDCKIMRIEKGAFSTLLKYLNSLNLSNNKIRELDEDIFQCPALEELFLDGNDLERIHDNTFIHLKNLKSLHLQHNMLQKCSFKLPRTLTQLDLYDNDIKSFELNLTEVQLHYLNLCGNYFRQFPLRDSTKNINLKLLCLSGEASHLPQQFATRFPGLLNLTLQGSNIRRTELNVETQTEIRKLSNITILSLDYFHIQNLDFIINKNKLTLLTLRNITLENTIGVQNVFRTMPYLNRLCIDQSPDLVKPVLGEGSVVSQLIRLEYLSIQHTLLLSITQHNIPQSVVKLNIANNPLRCDCKLSWIVAKQKASKGQYLEDVAHTTCSTPPKFDEQELTGVVDPATCHDNLDGMLEQNISTSNSTTEKSQDMSSSDHTVLYIVLGSCLVVLLLIGILLAIVLSVMKRKRKHHITPEGGETPMEQQQQQQQQMKQSSSHDMLLKK